MEKWEGEERRQGSRDHDVLTRIDANLSNFMSRFDEHVGEDKEKFESLTKGQNKLMWYLGVGFGILITLKFLLK